jgi:hypothetical protein
MPEGDEIIASFIIAFSGKGIEPPSIKKPVQLLSKVDIQPEFGRIHAVLSRSGGIGRRATFRA